jgi:hypothetical protein
VSLLIDEIGPATIVANSPDHIEQEVRDIASGRAVFRAGCRRAGNSKLFRRYIEFP